MVFQHGAWLGYGVLSLEKGTDIHAVGGLTSDQIYSTVEDGNPDTAFTVANNVADLALDGWCQRTSVDKDPTVASANP